MGSSLIRLLIVALAAFAVIGCGAEGATEEQGNTASISKEIPPPKSGAPHFEPAGNSLQKSSPADMKGKGPGTPGKN